MAGNMMKNSEVPAGHRITRRTVSESMDMYDDLPPEYRKLVREADFKITVTKVDGKLPTIEFIRNRLINLKNDAIRNTWGEDHPQFVK